MRKQGNKGKGDPSFPYYIPVERVAVIIENYIEKNLERKWCINEEFQYGLTEVGLLTGFDPRRIYAILKREYQTVEFATADQLLIGLDCMHLWHLSPEEGGLADLYECDTVQPELPPLTEHQKQVRAKHTAARNLKKQAQGQAVAA
jgi:hypothetical protein